VLPEELQNKQIRIAPGQEVTAHVRLAKGAQETFEVKDFTIRTLSSSRDYDAQIIGLGREVVTITFEGSKEAVAFWRERVEELKRRVNVYYDTDKIIAKKGESLAQPGASIQEYVNFEYLGVPDNLKVVTVSPSQVDVQVRRKS
jgi:hypothetical protein